MDGQHPILKPGRQVHFEPGGDAGALASVRYSFNALADFSQSERADEQGLRRRRLKPVHHRGCRFRPDQFRERTGINQVTHNLTFLGGERSRLIPISTPASGEVRINLTSETLRPLSRSYSAFDTTTAVVCPRIVMACGPS